MTIEVYSDGACEPNPGPGGWAFVVYQDGKERYHAYGYEPLTTNNRMEMTGALRGIEWIAQHAAGGEISFFSDSQYTVRGCNEWRLSWKKRGWKRGMKPIANLDLWQRLDIALMASPMLLTWIKGHAGNEGNERADKLSFIALGEGLRGPTEAGDYLTDEYRRVMAE